MTDTPVIRVQHLKKHFPVTKGLIWMQTIGWVKAVDDISFSVHQGETLALVGESGCGKTTTAKLILRLEEPTEGQIFLDEQEIQTLRGSDLKEYRIKVQAVFQDPWSSLSPRMRVRAIVKEPLIINHKVSNAEAEERVKDVLNSVGLRPEQANLYPHEFSGGQRQRIAVASALVSSPKLIILDEPVSALDVSIRAQIMNLLVDLQQEYNVSYLLIAHHLATTRYMAHEVAVMYLGKIVERSKTEELFDHPLHPYTKALFSAALPGHPDTVREEIILPGEVPSPINPPSGCHVHPRCPAAMPHCAEIEPEAKEISPGHFVSCHLY
jgi:peptide/nickel transport system ATP-binding protein/oligopeptide transport system ATP-binding protein